jgi:hypothetical protein
MVRFKLGRDLEDFATGNKQHVVFKLIEVARREGFLDDLVIAAREAVPGNPKLASLRPTHGEELFSAKQGLRRYAAFLLTCCLAGAGLFALSRFSLPPRPPGTFSMAVFVHGPAGPQETILRGQGKVVMDLRGNRRSEMIDDKGVAHFPGIPEELREQEVAISVEADGFEIAERGPRKLAGESLYLPVHRTPGRLHGMVTNEQGEPIASAELDLDGQVAQTDAKGRFNVPVPGDQVKPEMTLRIHSAGFQRQTLTVVPGANEIQVRLERVTR